MILPLTLALAAATPTAEPAEDREARHPPKNGRRLSQGRRVSGAWGRWPRQGLAPTSKTGHHSGDVHRLHPVSSAARTPAKTYARYFCFTPLVRLARLRHE